MSVFSELNKIVSTEKDDVVSGHEFQKLLQIFFLGSLVGLPTLSSILRKFNVTSNDSQVKYKKICKNLSSNKIRLIFEYIFEQEVLSKLSKMSKKDISCWSKELVTVVLDDSIFRQWIQNTDRLTDPYYGSFFSGQFGTTVYGYKVVTLALSIDGVLYPLYFDFVKKKEAESYEKATEVAQKLVNRFGVLAKKSRDNGLSIPALHFSCDNGYNDPKLAKICLDNNLIFISVPKKTEKIEVDNKVQKMSNWINEAFMLLEEEHQKKEENLPDSDKTAFTHRFRAKYQSRNEVVTFLAFRLNGSKKVSVIYSYDKNIFAKTMRRHWFQRTHIEQFFKLLKHVLQIKEARVTNKIDFEIKLNRFAFIALHAQKLVRFVRKKVDEFKNKGFISIQRILNSDPEILDLLQRIL
ncbi:MAG: hypothetical protein U5M51_14595 [Emticicia sp.]|nr:hypothetical protein [Emticicia sp.]